MAGGVLVRIIGKLLSDGEERGAVVETPGREEGFKDDNEDITQEQVERDGVIDIAVVLVEMVLLGKSLMVVVGMILLAVSSCMLWGELMLRIALLIWAMMVSLPVAASASQSARIVFTKKGA